MLVVVDIFKFVLIVLDGLGMFRVVSVVDFFFWVCSKFVVNGEINMKVMEYLVNWISDDLYV